jgi:hypothetical protein
LKLKGWGESKRGKNNAKMGALGVIFKVSWGGGGDMVFGPMYTPLYSSFGDPELVNQNPSYQKIQDPLIFF